jgi:hypothetical protein
MSKQAYTPETKMKKKKCGAQKITSNQTSKEPKQTYTLDKQANQPDRQHVSISTNQQMTAIKSNSKQPSIGLKCKNHHEREAIALSSKATKSTIKFN